MKVSGYGDLTVSRHRQNAAWTDWIRPPHWPIWLDYRATGWNACVETAKDNTAFESMINGEFVLSGKTRDRKRSKSLITTNRRTGYG